MKIMFDKIRDFCRDVKDMTDGRFEIRVPPGSTRVTLERGFETDPVSVDLDLAPGAVTNITLSAGRFIDMQAEGWVSGDTHIHWSVNSWDANLDLGLLSVVQRASMGPSWPYGIQIPSRGWVTL